MKQILTELTPGELAQFLKVYDVPDYRARQLYLWLMRGADFSEMQNLPKSLRDALSQTCLASGVKIAEKRVSEKDGTVKYLFELYDGNLIEGVAMRYKYGNTVCISTQVGCRMNCAFCASGLDGLVRNLSAGEMLSEVIAVNRDLGGGEARAVTNVVLMGSGEPLDNYEAVAKWLGLVTDPAGLGISRRNISLSTSGISDGIRRLADDGLGVTLTISLHAPDDEVRKTIMPVANAYPIGSVLDAAKYYFEKTGRRVIFEYALIAGVNDFEAQAEALAKLIKGMPAHVNLIRLNPVKEKQLKRTSSDAVNRFMQRLQARGISVTLRRSMGSDLDGACGQLRRSVLSDKVSLDILKDS